MKRERNRASSQLLPLALLSCLVLVAASAWAADEPGYGFYRTVEGDVRLTTLDRAEPLDIEPNYPLLLGDRVWIAAGSRLEAVLPDQTLLRAGGGTDLYFEDLALYADDSASSGTVLRLLEGEVQVVVTDFGNGVDPLRIDTPNATVYLQEAGTYRVFADERKWTEVVVRDGFSEVALAEGSIVVRANEAAVIDGEDEPRVRVYPAGAVDDLEAWAAELDRGAELASTESYVGQELAYQAAPLETHGEWLPLETGYAWRPRVAVGWRPYSHGRWTYTPAGLYWVSGYPWGALTFHYGSWNLHAHYGWVWHPGRVFAPAWVHWYWGPSYVGWVPSGYYSHHYGRHYHHGPSYSAYGGFHFGTYGYAGGSWGHYAHWTFSPVRYFGWRSYHTHWRSGAELDRRHRGTAVPRGVIATDTRGLDRYVWGRPDRAREVLLRGRSNHGHRSTNVPDVTDFVARERSLPSDVREAVFAKPGEVRSLHPRAAAVGEAPQAGSRGRSTPGWGASASKSLPPRPDLGRVDIARHEARTSGSGSFSRDRGSSALERGDLSGSAPSRSLIAPNSSRTLPRSSGLTGGSLGSRFDSREGATPPAGKLVGLPASPKVDGRRPTLVRPDGSRQSLSPRTPSGALGSQRLPAPADRSASRPSFNDSRQPLQEGSRWAPPTSSRSAPSAGRKTPVVQRVLESIRGNRQATPARPPTSGLSAPPTSGGSTLRRPSSPSASGQPSRSFGSTPRVSPPPRSNPPSVSRPGTSGVSRPGSSSPRGRSSASSSSSSKFGQSASSSRSQSRSKTKPPG